MIISDTKEGNRMESFSLESYLTSGVKKIVKGIWKASIKNPRASLFMMKYIESSKKASMKRKESENEGKHIPPFLIASITTKCNLHCKGCYARANHNCFDETEPSLQILSAQKWDSIFTEAEELGISFILLAGGEPMLRRDVLEMAGLHKKILFPIFTNGTMLQEQNLNLFSEHPNLLPVLSIEGEEKTTDLRRGKGTYANLVHGMQELKQRGIVYGSSVTVQKDNMKEVTGERFLEDLIAKGCKAVIYVEYVPVSSETENLAPEEEDRVFLTERLKVLRVKYPQLLFVSFPGDEKTSGGCLAAGRGFFHINAYGSAEPCPFSAYSDTSLSDVSLKEALQSPLFMKLQSSGTLMTEHKGGCVLFEQEEIVKKMCEK